MKQKLLLFLSLITYSLTFAQDYYKQGSFVIKGQVKNPTKKLIDVGLDSYLGSFGLTIVLNPDGTYEHRFPVQHRQNLFISLNDSLPIFLSIEDQDTIVLNWDNSDLQTSLFVSGKNELRTKELQIQLKTEVEYVIPYIKLSERFYKDRATLSSESKFNLVNELFNKQVKSIIDNSNGFVSNGLRYHITSVYFRYTDFLRLNSLLPKFKLQLNNISAYPDLSNLISFLDDKTLSEDWFWNVPDYRTFIFNYVSFFHPFNTISYVSKTKPVNPTLDNYYKAMSDIEITSIQEWFITQSIFRGFQSYEFSGAEITYNTFINNCTVPYLKDTLQKYYTAIKKLKPGNPAPAFTLTDEKGKSVSLNDFKGKVVYIDFWGVYCGPCINEIENYADKLHEKYKNADVVFLNICVDSKETIWKAALKKYHLKGINLIAEGWTNNPICKEYNVNGIPHYVLIDKNGNIVDNNAPRPSSFNLSNGNNLIDRLLK